MKTILLLRHAKSSWSDPSLADVDRPLAKRGRKDAPRMGAVLSAFDCVPDVILSSPARRARETAELTARAAGFRGDIRWEESFYGGSAGDLMAALRRLPDDVQRPMLVGHNPTMEATAAALLGDGAFAGGGVLRMPTAALVCLEIGIDRWVALQRGEATLRWFLIPRLVKALQT